jgi:hypothetical protein
VALLEQNFQRAGINNGNATVLAGNKPFHEDRGMLEKKKSLT